MVEVTLDAVRGYRTLRNENPRMGVRGSLGRGWMGGLAYSPRKKSSGFSLIVTPSAHVSELSDPFKRHRMNHWPTLSRITSYPAFFQCTTLPASTASLISLSFIVVVLVLVVRGPTYRTTLLVVKRENTAP